MRTILILLALTAAARADPPHAGASCPPGNVSSAPGAICPSPQPQIGAGCPPGYQSSPTSGFCVPSAGTRCRAVPSSGSCPAGWTFSPTSRTCVESHC
jgi:hypothetical protein